MIPFLSQTVRLGPQMGFLPHAARPGCYNSNTLAPRVATTFCCCSVTQSCPALCDPMDCSMPDFPVLHHLLEFAQSHVHPVSDAIQPSHLCYPLLLLPSLFPKGLFQWVGSSHQMTKVLELQLQHQSFQWIFRGLTSFRIDWCDLLAIQGTLKSLLQYHRLKATIIWL